MRLNLLLLIFSTLAIVLHLANCTEPLTSIIKLKDGQIQGKILSLNVPANNTKKVELFEGIRYAQSTRFQKPTAVQSWSGIYQATTKRASCPQFGLDFQMNNQTTEYDENCLFLNLFRPAQPKAKRSVMVFIHGGVFESGTIFADTFDARYIASEGDVIVVLIQYRLGPLGFISGGNVTANLGLHDQLFALRYIKENIHAFGGNPEDITIFGQSAGSMSVGALVLSPLAKGLFKRAIMQSGAPSTYYTTEPLAKAALKVGAFAKKVGCPVEDNLRSTITCLAGKSVQELKVASKGNFEDNTYFLPVFGDEILPIRPLEALKTGQFNDVDLIFGTNRDEGTMYVTMTPEILKSKLTVQQAKEAIIKMMKTYGEPIKVAQEVASYYLGKLGPNATETDFILAISNVSGDYGMICPTLFFGEAYAKRASAQTKIYFYRLMQPMAFPGYTPPAWTGVQHGQDLYYLFQSQIAKLIPQQHSLSEAMIHSWTSFSKSSIPGRMDQVEWKEAFVNRSGGGDFIAQHMHLEAGHYQMVSGYFREICDGFWKAKIFS